MNLQHFLHLDDQLTLAARRHLGGGAGRWERYLKLKFISALANGQREQLPEDVRHIAEQFEHHYGSLNQFHKEMLQTDTYLWGHNDEDWSYTPLPGEQFFKGSPEECVRQLMSRRLHSPK